MPRTLVRATGHTRKRSLFVALAWIERHCVHGPGDVEGEPVVHGDETAGLILDCYTFDADGKLQYDAAFYSRPKGCDKSGLAGRLVLLEAVGPCRFDGWAQQGDVYRCADNGCPCGWVYAYQVGEPRGKRITYPFIRCMATEEGQSGNTYRTVHFNFTDDRSPLSQLPGVDAGASRIFIPGGGEIRPSTASGASKDGGLETFAVFDETHLYDLNELREMYGTVTRNLRKRKKIAGTWYIETTTMFKPGANSVAEASYTKAGLIERKQEAVAAGRKAPRNLRERLLCDHRWGDCTDTGDEPALRAALVDAFGEAMAWQDLDGLVDEFYDPKELGPGATDQDSRRYFLNAVTEAATAWLAEHEIRAVVDDTKVLADRDVIALGCDLSRHRARGVTDASALIACRLSDLHVFELAVWEQPRNEPDWSVPIVDVEAEVAKAFRRFNVVGFYADPALWEQTVGTWEAKYGRRLKVKATRDHPIQWWMTGGRGAVVVKALERFHTAIVDGECSIDGSSALVSHLRHAQRRDSRAGIQIGKSSPSSPNKIDAAVAALLAFTAALDALAAGVPTVARPVIPARIR